MTQFPFKQLDVFTARPFYGNPVAVVIGADELDTARMQRIARWTNLSETTFLLKPTQAGADYRLRIFTPHQELPFAGHPTLGSAHAALEAGVVRAKNEKLKQECGAGVLDLSLEGPRIYVRAPQPNVSPAVVPLFGTSQALRVDVGPVWIVVDLGDAQHLRQWPAEPRALDRGGRIGAGEPFGVEEAMELPDSGEPPRRRGGLQAALRQFDQIGADIVGRSRSRPALAYGEAEIILEIALIGLDRVLRRAALGRQHVEEAVQPGTRLPAHFCSFEGGTISTISRGSGFTKVTSASMPP